jgi:hypothetical protein
MLSFRSACATADFRDMGVVACFDSGRGMAWGGTADALLKYLVHCFVARVGSEWLGGLRGLHCVEGCYAAKILTKYT